MAYRTRTEEMTERYRNEQSQTRAMTDAFRNAGLGKYQSQSSGAGGSIIDGLIIGAITLVFYGTYHLLRGLCLGLFYTVRWCFRRITRSKGSSHQSWDSSQDETEPVIYDTSSVFHIDTLNEKDAAAFDEHLPWIFETDEYRNVFASEDEACEAQRDHRHLNGFDQITGERFVHQSRVEPTF